MRKRHPKVRACTVVAAGVILVQLHDDGRHAVLRKLENLERLPEGTVPLVLQDGRWYALGNEDLSMLVSDAHTVESILQSVVVFESAGVADRLCAENAWDRRELQVQALELGLRYRQLDVIEQSLSQLDKSQRQRGVVIFTEFVEHASLLQGDSFMEHLLRAGVRFLIKCLTEEPESTDPIFKALLQLRAHQAAFAKRRQPPVTTTTTTTGDTRRKLSLDAVAVEAPPPNAILRASTYATMPSNGRRRRTSAESAGAGGRGRGGEGGGISCVKPGSPLDALEKAGMLQGELVGAHSSSVATTALLMVYEALVGDRTVDGAELLMRNVGLAQPRFALGRMLMDTTNGSLRGVLLRCPDVVQLLDADEHAAAHLAQNISEHYSGRSSSTKLAPRASLRLHRLADPVYPVDDDHALVVEGAHHVVFVSASIIKRAWSADTRSLVTSALADEPSSLDWALERLNVDDVESSAVAASVPSVGTDELLPFMRAVLLRALKPDSKLHGRSSLHDLALASRISRDSIRLTRSQLLEFVRYCLEHRLTVPLLTFLDLHGLASSTARLKADLGVDVMSSVQRPSWTMLSMQCAVADRSMFDVSLSSARLCLETTASMNVALLLVKGKRLMALSTLIYSPVSLADSMRARPSKRWHLDERHLKRSLASHTAVFAALEAPAEDALEYGASKTLRDLVKQHSLVPVHLNNRDALLRAPAYSSLLRAETYPMHLDSVASELSSHVGTIGVFFYLRSCRPVQALYEHQHSAHARKLDVIDIHALALRSCARDVVNACCAFLRLLDENVQVLQATADALLFLLPAEADVLALFLRLHNKDNGDSDAARVAAAAAIVARLEQSDPANMDACVPVLSTLR